MTRPLKLMAGTALVAGTALFGSWSAQAQDIVEVASGNESFRTLVEAVKAAGLAETLQGEGPFTVFAPTDEAFAQLPEGTLENLLKPENQEQLKSILTYHVVPGEITSDQLAGQQMAVETVQGAEVQIDAANGGVMVNDASVVQPDVQADNGVIHAIDKVIMPPM